MPLRDYTDYLPLVFGSKERVYYIQHLRHLRIKGQDYLFDPEKVTNPKITRPIKSFTVNGHSYVFNPDRAIRVNWAPWKKFFLKKFLWSLTELTRSKKIGLLLYQEPGDGKLTEEKVPVEWKCPACAFKSAAERGIKTHIRTKHKDLPQPIEPIIKYKVVKKLIAVKEPVEPMDLSRIQQPSGVFTNESG